MPSQEDTLRSTRYYARSEREQIAQHGADELAPRPEKRRAAGDAASRQANRAKLGVNEEHKTEAMRKRRRGTFP